MPLIGYPSRVKQVWVCLAACPGPLLMNETMRSELLKDHVSAREKHRRVGAESSAQFRTHRGSRHIVRLHIKQEPTLPCRWPSLPDLSRMPNLRKLQTRT